MNLFFFAFFCFELFAKLLGEGFKKYLRDRFNWFDSAVVIVSAIDISLIFSLRTSVSEDGNSYLLTFHLTYFLGSSKSGGSGAITALRIIRLVRVFQLGKLWKDF